jgi:hypothetical protein
MVTAACDSDSCTLQVPIIAENQLVIYDASCGILLKYKNVDDHDHFHEDLRALGIFIGVNSISTWTVMPFNCNTAGIRNIKLCAVNHSKQAHTTS